MRFLDYDDQISGTVEFGTPDPGLRLLSGWHETETWDGQFPFRWAGGSSSAELVAAIPPGTEAVLLEVLGYEDGLQMEVLLDGNHIGTVRVDAYWHTAYVPIGPPPTQIADSGRIAWGEFRVFPRFPGTDRIYAFPTRHPFDDHRSSWSRDWRIDQSYEAMMALTLVGMQGVINRNGSRVYLDWDDPWERSSFWISAQTPGGTAAIPAVYFDFDPLSTINFLTRRFGDRFTGAVRYDPRVPDTINLATMLAGLDDRVIIAPAQEAIAGFPTFSDVRDICSEVGVEHCDPTDPTRQRIELYQWAYDELWPQLSHRLIMLLSPGPPSSEPVPGTSEYFPLGLAARDYAVALRLPVLWLEPPDIEPFPDACSAQRVEIPPGSEAALLAAYMEEAEGSVPVNGFYGSLEPATVAMASWFGHHVPVLSNSNTPTSAGNLTVFSGRGADPLRIEGTIDWGRMAAALEAEHVFTMFASDGDNIQFLVDRGFHPSFVWESVQGHRFGWTINPTLLDIAPPVWNHYVTERDAVSLVTGLSGAGYAYPQLMAPDDLAAYIAVTGRYLDESGLRTIHVSDRFGSWGQVAVPYYLGLPNPGFLGAFVGSAGWPWGPGFTYADVPVPAVHPAYILTPGNGRDVLADLLAHTPGRVFVDLAGDQPWYWDDQDTATYLWHTGEDVCLDDACRDEVLLFAAEDGRRDSAVWGPFAALPPGDYRAIFRMMAGAGASGAEVATVWVTTSEGCRSTPISSAVVHGSDLSPAGGFHDVILEFSLKQPTADLEFQVSYRGGADLYVDTIEVTRSEPLDLPVFAAGFIPLTWGDGVAVIPALADMMEQAGVLVLTPDEFMASLNPEFMTEWAAEVRGPDHPGVIAAREFLEAGAFFESLMAARRALRG